jgi:CheY-like chemotaxis protein
MSDADRQPLALVIDDEESIRQIARMALRADGWRVEEASDGREGLRLAREHKPSLIVVDMMLPSMSGVEVCRKASQEPSLAQAAFLMISGINEKASALADFWELPLKTRDFLKKPFDLADLTRRARKLVVAAGLEAPPAPAAPAPKAPESKATEPRARAPRPMGDEPSLFPKLPKAPPQPVAPPESLFPAPERSAASPFASPSRPTAPFRPSSPSRPAASPSPASRPSSGRSSLLAGNDDHPRGYRVLVIDDDEDIRVIFQAHLSRFHVVETAVNGMEGLKAMETFRPDFVVTDVNMPVMNGLETAEAIRQHPAFFEVPIFFVTGETDEALPRKAYEIGGNLYLRKPIDPDRLLKCIDYFLKETRLTPGAYLAESLRPKPASAPAKASAVGAALPRVLVVDFNIEDHHLLKRLLGEEGRAGLAPGGPLEVFWIENPRAALGNLTRWEPDVVFYNPRNPNMDAIAFGQTLRLNKELSKTRLWLIGARFYEADVNYSRQSLGHEVVRLDQDDATLADTLGKALAEVRAAGLRPKTHSWRELRAEEVERLRQLQQSDARRARERDMLRKRYRAVQEFIDQTLR